MAFLHANRFVLADSAGPSDDTIPLDVMAVKMEMSILESGNAFGFKDSFVRGRLLEYSQVLVDIQSSYNQIAHVSLPQIQCRRSPHRLHVALATSTSLVCIPDPMNMNRDRRIALLRE